MAFTRTPNGPKSTAIWRVRPITPALRLEYARFPRALAQPARHQATDWAAGGEAAEGDTAILHCHWLSVTVNP